jgi:hypothetical protein
LFKKGGGDGIVCAPGELGDEIDAFCVDGPASADSEDDKAHVGTKVAVLIAAGVSRDGKVGSET